MKTSTITQNNTTSTNSQGTTMITFEQAVYNRILTCKTWNHTRLQTVVRDMWSKEQNVTKSSSTGEFLKLFFQNFEAELKRMRYNFFDTPIICRIYSDTWNKFSGTATEKQDYIKDVIEAEEKPAFQVFVYTDGSCNTHSEKKAGGWGVHITVKGYPKYDKDFSGFEENTTNNSMELKAMIEAIKSIDFSKEGFVFNIITDSKYVLQTLINLNRYSSQGYNKVANKELVKKLKAVVSEKGLKFPRREASEINTQSLQSGDVFFSTSEGKVNFYWVKGHSGNIGNDKADKLALNARKQLEEMPKEVSEVVAPEEVQEPLIELPVDSSGDSKVVTQQMLDEAKTFEDVKNILELSSTLKLGGTCSEDFTFYTKVLHKGKSIFEIVSTERVSSREGYIRTAISQLTPYLKEEGIYSVDLPAVDSTTVTPSDLEAVVEYNKLNSTHDYTYMMSDDSRSYAAGLKSEKALAAIESTLSPLQLDLVAIYHNHVLNRAGQFGKDVNILIDCVESSYKYFRKSLVVFNETNGKYVATDLEFIGTKFASSIVNSLSDATVMTPFHADIIVDSLNNYGGDSFVAISVLNR